MKLRMRDEDRRAMDILMDRAPAAAAAHDAGYAAIDSRLRERVGRVEKVLNLLGQMPAADPPRNLAASTLRYIEEASGQRMNRPAAQHGLFNGDGPVA